MCRAVKYKTSNVRIDKCMKRLISFLKDKHEFLYFPIVACCCGHGKYPMTIVANYGSFCLELLSGQTIPRVRRIYKKDKRGVYYIPEVLI